MAAKYFYIYFEEKTNKVRRKLKRADLTDDFELVGTMTQVELELLLELIFERFGDRNITLRQFQRYFGDLKQFCQRVKMILEE